MIMMMVFVIMVIIVIMVNEIVHDLSRMFSIFDKNYDVGGGNDDDISWNFAQFVPNIPG